MDLRVHLGIVRVAHLPLRIHACFTGIVRDFEHILMAMVLLEASPKFVDVSLLTFENGEKMSAGE